MKIITLNANGIRAAKRKGLFEWLVTQQPDIVCLQETKAQLTHLEEDHYCLPGYHCFYHDAQKSGYSGVAIYCRNEPDKVIQRLGWACADEEGRYVQADFGQLSIASFYMPSGTTGEVRQKIKYDFMDYFMRFLKKMAKSKRQFIICGD